MLLTARGTRTPMDNPPSPKPGAYTNFAIAAFFAQFFWLTFFFFRILLPVGDARTRTGSIMRARQAFYQLNYVPLERKGFEPMIQKIVFWFSKPTLSATQPSLLLEKNLHTCNNKKEVLTSFMGCSAKPAGLVSQATPTEENLDWSHPQHAKLTERNVRTH